MRLSDYAAQNNLTYLQAWRKFSNGEIANAKKVAGQIIVDDPKPLGRNYSQAAATPISAALSEDSLSVASTRTNKAAHIDPINRFNNIDKLFVPFKYSLGAVNNSNLDTRDVIILCQKAYFGFAVVKNTIDTMTEFSASEVYFTGGTAKSRDFFKAYFKKIGLTAFTEEFFREFYRSANVFIYPQNVQLLTEDIVKLTQVYGLSLSKASQVILPARYIVLNPADIQIQGSSSFVNGIYYKVLTDYELERLRNPKTDEDREILESFPPDIQETIKNKRQSMVRIPLDFSKVYAVFNKKMSYEPFAVSMIYPVLDDLEFKTELKKMDRAICRTVQQANLFITLGYEDKNGNYNYNQKAADALANIFQNESVGHVVIADFTTKAQFVIPTIGDILAPEKYQIVNEDIRQGLNDILFSGSSSEKFANQQAKIKIFVEKLKQARESFLNSFLIPEIKRISKIMGFRTFPEPHFKEMDLDNDIEFARIFSRLAEIGFLTPEETFDAIETRRLPTKEESLDSQSEFKDLKDKGFYEPIVGGPKTQKDMQTQQLTTQKEISQMNNETKLAMPKNTKKIPGTTGRPSGIRTPQSTKKMTPIGAKFSLKKVYENLALASQLQTDVEKFLKKQFKIKELTPEQKAAVDDLSELIIANEQPELWKSQIQDYFKNPVDKNPSRIEELNSIAFEHQVDNFLAAILLNSKLS